MKKFLFAFIFLLAFGAVHAQPASESVMLTDMLKIKTVSNIVTTNEGTMAAFTLTSIEPDEKKEGDYKYITQLYKLDLTATAAPVQLTFSRESSSGPAWSPDGKTIAFTRAVDGKPQIFLLPINGGEAYQLTKASYGASAPKWSPDGQRLVFAASIQLKDYLKDSSINPQHLYAAWPMEKAGLTNKDMQAVGKGKGNPNGSLADVRTYLLNNEAEGKATVLTKLNFQDEMNVSGAVASNQFFVVDIKNPTAPRLLTPGFYRWGSIDFTPDGKRLIIAADVDSVESPDRSLENEIYTADADGGNLRLLLGKKDVSYSSAKISPSGKWLAYLYGATRGDISEIAIMPLNGLEKDAVTIPFDRAKAALIWSSDEKYIYFTAQSNGGALLYRLTVATKKIEPLSAPDAGITAYALGRDKFVFSKTEVADPSAIYTSEMTMKNATKLSSFNDWVKTKKLSVPEKHTFVNSKGLTVDYWVMKPYSYEAGKKYPLLLEIHGGPTAMWGPGEASMWHEFQYFCGKGYGVVYSNPRGSGGYGDAFLKANVGDWGAGPTSDVLTALDKTAAEGWADTSKLVVTGGSYAGYLVAWIISHDHRFKAACSQRGVYDLATFFGEGNAWRLVPQYFGGYPWEPKVKELLQHESPINYVQNISTPYIIFHGDNDRRTGFVQGEMMYRSLKVLNRPVEYVRHPNATHEITRSGDNRQRMDQMLRTWEFFERWLK